MAIDMNDPKSIRAWVDFNRERHLPQLRAMYRLPVFAKFRDNMVEAMRGN